jgi:hypothetical protein
MKYSILALGDSYTIGEGVPLYESFPYQAVQMLRQEGLKFYAPEIIAKTGWTTFELKDHLSHTIIGDKYDFVTLLIGVNNQYRGLSVQDYKSDFELLLNKAINLVDEPGKVIVLSIPDWGATPFADGRNKVKITEEIDEFNNTNQELTFGAGVHYIDVTSSSRQAGINEDYITADKLHYSGLEYKKWAGWLVKKIKDEL